MFVSSSRVLILCEENIKIYFVYIVNNSVDLDHVSTFTVYSFNVVLLGWVL